MSWIAPRLTDGLCNRLFQIVAASYHAKKNNRSLVFYIPRVQPSVHSNCTLIFKLFPHINIVWSVKEHATVKEGQANFAEFAPLQIGGDNTVIEGYFQNWSYFEDWNPYYNYLVAKEHCGLVEESETNPGTFTNYAQNDQDLYSLHVYLMYLKFGFGRATQDAGIDIRRGAMSRDQAINLVRAYDGHYPEKYIQTYLDYFKMTFEEFDLILDKWANRDLFRKVAGRWQPTFKII